MSLERGRGYENFDTKYDKNSGCTKEELHYEGHSFDLRLLSKDNK